MHIAKALVVVDIHSQLLRDLHCVIFFPFYGNNEYILHLVSKRPVAYQNFLVLEKL